MRRCFPTMCYIVCLTAFASISNANSTLPLEATETTIENITHVIDHLKKSSSLTVYFPNEIYIREDDPKKLYASFTGDDLNQAWCIHVGTATDCEGAHYCAMGSLCAENNGEIDPYYSTAPAFKKIEKQDVMLADGQHAYFTPAHAEADWRASMIEWKDELVLYTFTWNVPKNNEKQIMLTMVNSAKHPGTN